MAAERVRLYVGGLGPSVNEADLKRALGSLGQVASVEIVRTRGRDFAFVDFEAASAAALRKVFSTYSGCRWKGGCLRVEKAKEDYMTRLRREWEVERASVEEAKAEAVPKSRDANSLDINIYFPRLRKKKCILGKGTGRHKRSFERVETLPIAVLRLCDCDEHESQPDDLDFEHGRYLKLVEQLEKDYDEGNRRADEHTQGPKEDLADDKEATDSASTEEDKAASPGTDKSKSSGETESSSKEVVSDDEELAGSEDEEEATSEEGLGGQKDQPTTTSKWDRIFKAAATVGDNEDSPQDKSSRKRKVDAEAAELPVSKPKQKARAAEAEQPAAATEQQKPSNQCSWVQRGSWKDMVGSTGIVSFSLGNLLGSSDAQVVVPRPSVAFAVPQPAQAPVQAVKSPAIKSCPSSKLDKPLKPAENKASASAAAAAAAAKSGACTFMRPAGAEQQWLGFKEKLRSDARTQHKAAIKMKRKLTGLS